MLFGNEENGLAGGKAYAKEFAQGHVAAIEADIGAGPPEHFRFKLPEGYTKMDALTPVINQQLAHLPLSELKKRKDMQVQTSIP